MKLILSSEEIMVLLKRSFPPHLIPDGYEVTGVESKGYPIKEFCISIDPKEEEPT